MALNFSCALLALLLTAPASRAQFIIEKPEYESSASQELFGSFDMAVKLRQTCFLKTGHNDTFLHLKTLADQLPNCVDSYLDLEQFRDDLENLSRQTQLSFLKLNCPKMRNVLSNCLDTISAELRQCLDMDELALLDEFGQILPRAVKLLCQDPRKLFLRKSANFLKCFQAGNQCWDGVPFGLQWESFEEVECADVVRRQECVHKKMIECGAPKLGDLFELFYQPTVKLSPCGSKNGHQEES